MKSLLTSPYRFALLTLSMVLVLGHVLPRELPVSGKSQTVAVGKPSR
jgi:hypothetical protein